MKRGLVGLGVVVLVVLLAGGGFVMAQTSAFDASMDQVYDVPVPAVARSTDHAVLARGEHLAKAVAPCTAGECHGEDLGGGRPIAMGPIGTFVGPNISEGGLGAAYTDGELARLVQHGIKKDGRSLRFMPSQDMGWLPDADVAALVSWLRTRPAIERPNAGTLVGPLGKVLDRQGAFVLDVARRIDHTKREPVPAPAPTAEYGRFLIRLCTGCHGEHLTGGRIPGSPSKLPTPLNLTPDATGLAGWTYEDFDKLLVKGIRKSGKALDPFMPITAFGQMDETEKRAMFAYLMTLPPAPLGGR
jgi:hypothetical protein